jgi:hypothetical protein
MGFVRSWLSGTARAMGISVLVPVVLVVVLLGATVGGVGGLGSLRQLVAGPVIPDDRTTGSGRSATREEPTSTLPAIPTSSLLPAPQGQSKRHARQRSRRNVTRTPGPNKRAPQTTTPTAPAAPTEQQPGTGSPTPRPHPLGAVRNLGERVRRAVEPLPAPVGPAASDAIETVLDIVDPPRRRPGVPLPVPGRSRDR